MLATDPLSLMFLGCAVFAGAFLVITTALGHGLHAGHVGHTAHVGHVGHMGNVGHAGHISHAGHVGHAGQPGQPGQAGAHAPNGHSAGHTQGSTGETSGAPPPGGPLAAFTHTLESALNVYGALTFLLIFGVLGYLLHNVASLGDVVSLLTAIVVGIACALAVSALLTRIFLASGTSGELTSENSRLEGRLGRVSMTIHRSGIGEVIYAGAAGGRQSLGARSVDGATIGEGTEVVVLGYRDGIATVQPWDAFMTSVRAGNAPVLEAIDGQP